MTEQIILKCIEQPRKKDINLDLDWICNSMGFSSGRDIDDTAARIFDDIVNDIARRQEVTSQNIASELDITVNTVNHHMRNFVASGFFVRRRNVIFLRGGSMKRTILEIKRDADRMFEDLLIMAEEVDRKLKIENR